MLVAIWLEESVVSKAHYNTALRSFQLAHTPLQVSHARTRAHGYRKSSTAQCERWLAINNDVDEMCTHTQTRTNGATDAARSDHMS